jgi:hypothetical protein
MPNNIYGLWTDCVNLVDSMFMNCLKANMYTQLKKIGFAGWVQTQNLYYVCAQNLPRKYTPILYFFNLLSRNNTHNPQGLLKQLLFYINIYFINDIHLNEVKI